MPRFETLKWLTARGQAQPVKSLCNKHMPHNPSIHRTARKAAQAGDFNRYVSLRPREMNKYFPTAVTKQLKRFALLFYGIVSVGVVFGIIFPALAIREVDFLALMVGSVWIRSSFVKDNGRCPSSDEAWGFIWGTFLIDFTIGLLSVPLLLKAISVGTLIQTIIILFPLTLYYGVIWACLYWFYTGFWRRVFQGKSTSA